MKDIPCTHAPPIVVSLSSFGATEVRRHGQSWFIDLAIAAGATGVEVRSELLRQSTAELAQMAAICKGMHTVYSCAEPLFSPAGKLMETSVDTALNHATLLDAQVVKFSIGSGARASEHQLRQLQRQLQGHSATVLVENDQSEAAGTIKALQHFLTQAAHSGLDLQMTFDIGNWHWTGECPWVAADRFKGRIAYVHTKGVLRQPQRWIAVPLADSEAPWRTVLSAMPADCPWAIEYPLLGDDLLAVTRDAIGHLHTIRGGTYVN